MRSIKRGQLPLLILGLLRQEREMYGYAIRQAVARMAEGNYELKEGTLYPLLRLLEEQGLIEHSVRPSSDGPPRKYYRLTESGLRYLETEKQSLQALATFVGGSS